MSDDWMQKNIELRELQFKHKQEYRNRIEELLEYDEKLIRLYYQSTFAQQLEGELQKQLLCMAYINFQVKNGNLCDSADCHVKFCDQDREPFQPSYPHIKEAAIEMATCLEKFAEELQAKAMEVRQKVAEIPHIDSFSQEDIKIIEKVIEQVDKELLYPYWEKIKAIHGYQNNY